MLKTLVKLLIAAAVLHACARASLVAWKYYQLKDTAHDRILFGANRSTADLQNDIVEEAAKADVPLQPENVDVQRDAERTSVDAHYTEPVALLPWYTYPVDLSFHVEAVATTPTTATDALGH